MAARWPSGWGRRLLAIGAVLAVVLPLVALPARAITGGSPDGETHPYVGLVLGGNALCTGALIAPSVVLTAGHCTDDFRSAGGPVYVTFDPDPTQTSAFYSGTPYTDPNYIPVQTPTTSDAAANDLGVILLDQPVSLSTYAALPRAGQDDALDGSDASLTAVGYGVQSFSSRNPNRATALGTRAATTLGIASGPGAVDSGVLELASAGIDGGSVCFGDSGGPILLGDTATVVAVISAGSDRQCQGPSFAARVDTTSALAFLAPFLRGVAPQPQATAPALAPATAPATAIAGGGQLQPGATVVVTANGVRLRQGPSLDSPVVTELSRGHVLQITGPSTRADGYTWWPVRDPNDPSLSGYVAAPYLEPQ